MKHLYTHVPFCPTICPYCDFHVVERRSGLVAAYLAELERDAVTLALEYPSDGLETVYVGGGTPSFLRDAEMESLVATIRRHFGWARTEATLEVNPGTVNPARAALWRDLGFTRASVGVQSAQDSVLEFLGRTHDAAQALRALETLGEAGLEVSADLITAVPGQDLERDLQAIAESGVNHVSCYTLTIEPGTPFHRQGVTVNEDDEARALERAEPVLLAYGLQRYEVSNHARVGFESQHNTAYWQNRHFYGLGAGAAGHYPVSSADPSPQAVIAVRRTNPHLHRWLEGARGDAEPVTREDFVTDALFNGLRLRRGIDLTDLAARAGLEVRRHFAAPLERCLKRGWLELEGETLRATREGTWVLNRVVAEFLGARPAMHA
jgi:oxygen-independent coproporphyrinogen-3 oxidase